MSNRYYVMSVNTRCGEHEFIGHYAFEVAPDETVEEVSNDILKSWYWYEYELDHLDDEGVAWFKNGNASHINRVKELTKSQYDTLNEIL